MKKTIGILIMTALFVLGGCIGEREKRVEEQGNNIEKSYIYHNLTFDTSKLNLKTLTEFSFSVLDDMEYVEEEVSEESEILSKIEFKYNNETSIGIIAFNKVNVDKEKIMKTDILETESYIKKAFGKIELKAERALIGDKSPIYIHGEVKNINAVKEAIAVYAEKNQRTYIIYMKSKLNDNTALNNFEAILSTIQLVKKTNSEEGTDDGGIINPEDDEKKYVEAIENVLDSSDVEIIEGKVQELYDYIDKTYIDQSITDKDKRKDAIYKFLSAWKYNNNKIVTRANVVIRDFYRAILEAELAKIKAIYDDSKKTTDRRSPDISTLENALNQMILRRYQENLMNGQEKVSFERVLNELHLIYDVNVAGGSIANNTEISSGLRELIKHYTEVIRIEYFNDNENSISGTQVKYWEAIYEKIVTYAGYLRVIEDNDIESVRVSLYNRLESDEKEENRIAAEFIRQQAVRYLVYEDDDKIGASKYRSEPSPRTVRTVLGGYVEGKVNDRSWVKEQRYGYYNNRLQESINKFYLEKGGNGEETAREAVKEAFVNFVNIAKYTENNIVDLTLNNLVTDEDMKDIVVSSNIYPKYKGLMEKAWIIVK